MRLGEVRSQGLVLGVAGIFVAMLMVVAPATGAESSWDGAAMIETNDSGDARAPHIALDAAGNGIAVWYQYDGVFGSRNNIWANRFVVGAGWGAPTLLETNDTGDATEPNIAMDANGNGIAVWQQYDGMWTNIWANLFVPGTGWGTATLIETNDTGSAYAPHIALDAAGNGLAIWEQYDGVFGFRNNIWANRYAPGTGWGNATLIETDDTGDAYEPNIAMDANGNGIAVWRQYDAVFGFRYNIWANLFVPGTGWGTPILLETDDTGDAGAPHIALAAGDGIAIWEQYDGAIGFKTNIWANRFVSGTGWGNATLVETDDSGDASAPRVKVDPNGKGIAVWRQYDGFQSNIRANRFTPGLGWGNATTVDTSGGDPYSPQLAIDAAGNGIAVWEQYDGILESVWASRFVPAKGWGTATLLETDNYADAYAPQVALNPAGNGIAVWEQYDWPRYNIWANRFVRDVTPPLLILTSPTETLTRNADVTVAGVTEPGAGVTVNGAPVSTGADGSFSTSVSLTEGVNAVAVVATDSEGNRASVNRSITRDSTPPSVTISMPLDGARLSSSFVRVTGTVEVGAVLTANGVRVEADPFGTWTVDLAFADGMRSIVVIALDAAGNVATVSRTVLIDTVAPEVTLTSPAGSLTRSSSVPVAGVVSDVNATVEVNAVGVAVNGTGGFSTTLNLAEGPNVISVVATDPAGNKATVTRTVVRDSIPPVLLVTTPSNGAAITGTVLTVTGTSEAGADVTVNGLRVAVDGTGAWSVTVSLPNGPGTIRVSAIDAAGNTAEVVRSVTMTTPDFLPPRLDLTSPTETVTNRETATVSGTTEANALVTVNGASVTVDANGRFSADVPLSAGANTITVIATDAAGNSARIERSITRDATAPVITVTSPAQSSTTDRSTVAISGSVDDASATVIVNGLSIRPDAGGQWSVTLSLVQGLNTIVVSAVDSAGNRAPEVSRAVTYTPSTDALGVTGTIAAMDAVLVAGVIVLAVLQLLLYRNLVHKIRGLEAGIDSVKRP